jgi:hypothetical protein
MPNLVMKIHLQKNQNLNQNLNQNQNQNQNNVVQKSNKSMFSLAKNCNRSMNINGINMVIGKSGGGCGCGR